MNTTMLTDGLNFPESPRWREGELWFCGPQSLRADLNRMGVVALAPRLTPGAVTIQLHGGVVFVPERSPSHPRA